MFRLVSSSMRLGQMPVRAFSSWSLKPSDIAGKIIKKVVRPENQSTRKLPEELALKNVKVEWVKEGELEDLRWKDFAARLKAASEE